MADFTPGQTLDPAQRVALTANGVTFNVWDNYRTEVYSQTVSEQGAIWQFQCLWEDRFTIAVALIGGGIETGSTVSFSNGCRYPDNLAWVAKKLDIKPDGPWKQSLYKQVSTSVLGAPPRALCLCYFGVPPYTDPQNVGEDELDFCSNSVPQTSQATAFKWKDDDTPIPADVNLPITYTTIKYTKTVYNRPTLNVPLIRSLVTHVNSSAFLGAPEGTVMFQGARSKRRITSAGALNWDITFQFEENSCTGMGGTTSGWNKLWKPKMGWTEFYVASPGNPPLFAEADLNQLLQS